MGFVGYASMARHQKTMSAAHIAKKGIKQSETANTMDKLANTFHFFISIFIVGHSEHSCLGQRAFWPLAWPKSWSPAGVKVKVKAKAKAAVNAQSNVKSLAKSGFGPAPFADCPTAIHPSSHPAIHHQVGQPLSKYASRTLQFSFAFTLAAVYYATSHAVFCTLRKSINNTKKASPIFGSRLAALLVARKKVHNCLQLITFAPF